MKEFALLFGVQFIQYFLATLNIRACAQANYVYTLLSDMLLAANGFFITKRVVESKSKAGLAGYVLGGALGSQVGIIVTKIFLHQ